MHEGAMMDLTLWLRQHGLSVRELADGIGLPLKTVEDWVYIGAMPSPANSVSLEDFVRLMCTHHWVIDAANGHLSRGVCKLCHAAREFENSQLATNWGRGTRRVS